MKEFYGLLVLKLNPLGPVSVNVALVAVIPKIRGCWSSGQAFVTSKSACVKVTG